MKYSKNSDFTLYICIVKAEKQMSHTILFTVVAAIVLILFAVLAMAFKVLMVKGSRFPMGHGAHHPQQHTAQKKTKTYNTKQTNEKENENL